MRPAVPLASDRWGRRACQKGLDQQAFQSIGFTLIELLAVIAIVVILMAVLLPTLQSVLRSTRQSTCVSNLRQIHTGMMLYSQDNHGLILPALGGGAGDYSIWNEKIVEYLNLKEKYSEEPQTIFACPETDAEKVGGAASHYGQNSRINQNYTKTDSNTGEFSKADLIYLSMVDRPSQTLYMADSVNPEDITKCWRNVSAYDLDSTAFRHNDMANLLFVDGHVESWKREEFPDEGAAAAESVPWVVELDP